MIKNSRYFVSFMISGLLAVTIPVFINPHKADANEYSENLCRKSVVGTYLSTVNQTNSTSGQPSSYRETITFTADGNLIANDSTAGGIPGSSNPVDQPFGPGQGRWKCTGNNEIVAKLLSFSFPSGSLPGNIIVVEYHLSFNPQARTVNGNVSYNLLRCQQQSPRSKDSTASGRTL